MKPSISKHEALLGAVRVLFLSALGFFVFSCLDTFAFQWYESSGNGLVNIFGTTQRVLTRVLQLILILGASGALFFAVYNLMEGDPQGAKRFAIWFVGLAIGLLVVYIFGKANMSYGSGQSAGSFSSLKAALKSVLGSMLIMVSMITVVQKVFQVVNGEKEGGRQLFKWFVVSVVGQMLISII